MARRLGRVVATAFVALTGLALTLTAAEHYLEQRPQAAPPYVIDVCAPHLGGCEPDPAPVDPPALVAAGPVEPAPETPGAPAPVVAPAPAPIVVDDVVDGSEPPVESGGGLGLMGVPAAETPDDAPPEPAGGEPSGGE